MTRFAIIIPTLNEERAAPDRVVACLALRPAPDVIVADGGSTDRTVPRCRDAGARIVVSPRTGRGSQMNAGAGETDADVLVFLHADVRLRQPAWSALVEALADPAVIGGAFRRRFDSPSWLLAAGSRLADLRGRWLRAYLGDQTIFARRTAFLGAGGFPDEPLFEDVEFSRRLRRLGRCVLVGEPVLASARRFDREGNARRLWRNVVLILLYNLGADPARLARRYYPGLFDSPRGGGRAPAGSPGGGRP